MLEKLIIQPPACVRWLFRKCLWRLPLKENERRIAITFDDGPIPEQTPWVLDLLDGYGIHATFFCVGENVKRYPELYAEIIRRGHSVGNHTYNHVQLFKVGTSYYEQNESKSLETMGGKVKYFRPPHGQLTPWYASKLHSRYNRVVLWDVMPKDYDKHLTPQEVFDNVRKYTREGSIIVFHDSIKAGDRMRYALQQTIETYSRKGYTFVSIDEALNN